MLVGTSPKSQVFAILTPNSDEAEDTPNRGGAEV